MGFWTVIWLAVILVLVVGAGWYIAGIVEKSGGSKECVFGPGPKQAPTLCYAWKRPGATFRDPY